MKVNSTLYKGIEYVQVSSLPPEQQELLLETINRDLIIKILVEGKLVGNCLQFKDYEVWFDNIFKPQAKVPAPTKNKKDKADESSVRVGLLKKI
ncbi:MAG: hypothetical protein C0490_22740 [Marivirga sp.]|nr:hypothetical protein [Marivirga sp.]